MKTTITRWDREQMNQWLYTKGINKTPNRKKFKKQFHWATWEIEPRHSRQTNSQNKDGNQKRKFQRRNPKKR